jgi:DNA-binding transcriptional LysR family regulator
MFFLQHKSHDEAADDLNVEILYDDERTVAAGAHSKWTRRRKIDLAELMDEPWVSVGATSWYHAHTVETFRARGLSRPSPMVTTDSIILRARLVAGGPYLSIFSTSMLRRLIADNYQITALPVDMPGISNAIVTLKNRTLSPVVERFLGCVREVAALGNHQRGGMRRSKSKSSRGPKEF